MWIYKEQQIQSLEDIPENVIGIVYKIEFNNRFYIGKKQLYSTTTKKLGKKILKQQALETANVRGRKKTKIKETKESNWLNYTSSCKELNDDIKYIGGELKKEILCFCYTLKQLSLYEQMYQFQYKVLEVDDCYNDNIGGKFFKTDIIK